MPKYSGYMSDGQTLCLVSNENRNILLASWSKKKVETDLVT